MSISTLDTLITNVTFDDKIYIALNSGDILTIPFDYTSRIQESTVYRLIGGRGIHFQEIDEDISLKGIILYKMEHELIAS